MRSPRMRDWNELVLARGCDATFAHASADGRSRPWASALAPDAVISLDCGANTHFAARMLMLEEGQRLTGTGLLATMAPGCRLPLRRRSPTHIVSRWQSSGMAALRMLMAELTTAVRYNLPVKVMILKNNSLAEVRFEQTGLGYPTVRYRTGTNRLRGSCESLRFRRLPRRLIGRSAAGH